MHNKYKFENGNILYLFVSHLTKRLSLKYVGDLIDATCINCIDSPPKYAPYVNLLNGINIRSHKPKIKITLNNMTVIDFNKIVNFCHETHFWISASHD